MINIQKQIEYWINGAADDFKTARILIAENRLLHGLFFCHLVIEKSIKAHVVKCTEDVAPRSHNLISLIEKTDLQLDEDTEVFLGILMKYQLQGRYPDYNPIIPSATTVAKYLEQTENLMTWLQKKL